jgi:hypothetical protein
MWGRVLHCAPLTILCENGIMGAVVMLCLVADFVSTNRRTRKNAKRFADPPGQGNFRNDFFFQPSAVIAVSNGLNAAFLAILVSAFLYELLYTPLLWHLIVINRLLYLVTRETEQRGESQLA